MRVRQIVRKDGKTITVEEYDEDEEAPPPGFIEEEDTTTPLQRLHYYALCVLKADKERPLDKVKMRERISELTEGTRGHRFPRDTWERDALERLIEIVKDLRKEVGPLPPKPKSKGE